MKSEIIPWKKECWQLQTHWRLQEYNGKILRIDYDL